MAAKPWNHAYRLTHVRIHNDWVMVPGSEPSFSVSLRANCLRLKMLPRPGAVPKNFQSDQQLPNGMRLANC